MAVKTQPWIDCTIRLPQPGWIVETKIHDEQGVRKVMKLKRLWDTKDWFPPFSAKHVSHTPTHWREL